MDFDRRCLSTSEGSTTKSSVESSHRSKRTLEVHQRETHQNTNKKVILWLFSVVQAKTMADLRYILFLKTC